MRNYEDGVPAYRLQSDLYGYKQMQRFLVMGRFFFYQYFEYLTGQSLLKSKILAFSLSQLIGAIIIISPSGSYAEGLKTPVLSGKITGVLATTTDYIPRGITQSDEKPALHGSITYQHQSGLYLNALATTINYDYDDHAHIEIDVCPGIKKMISTIEFDLSGCEYWYPGSTKSKEFDFFELRFRGTKNFETFSISMVSKYTEDFWYGTGQGLMNQASINVPLEGGFGILGDLARQSIENNEKLGIPDYNFWSAGIGYNYSKYSFILKYADTNISKINCLDGCDAKATLTAIVSF